jgi:RND family efflux transporter MFP subunit
MVVEGDRVAAGAAVAYLLSPAFLTAQAEFVRAVQRAGRLRATPDADGARALAEAARRRLRLLGVADSEMARLEAGGEPVDLLAITAPFAGSIVEVSGLAGAAAEPGTPIATLADLSALTVVADLPERALPVVRIGQRATVRIAVLPGARFVGRIERIRDQLDPATRTLKALIRVANPDHALKAGMFATVNLETSERGSGLTIPASAVITEGETRYVFVEVAPRTYERRTVDVEAAVAPGLPRASSRVVIRTGLVAGDRVVIHGAFTLKSELAKSSFGEEQD